MDCALLSKADLSPKATGPHLVILPRTPGHPSIRLSVPVALGGPCLDPLAARPTNSGARERFTLPHNSAGDPQSPGLAATSLPRRHDGSRAPARPAHPAHPNSGAPGGPPLPLSAWLLRHRPPSSFAAPARAHTRPTPPPTCPPGGGAPGCRINPWGEEGARPPPRARPIAPPAAAGSDAAPGPP